MNLKKITIKDEIKSLKKHGFLPWLLAWISGILSIVCEILKKVEIISWNKVQKLDKEKKHV